MIVVPNDNELLVDCLILMKKGMDMSMNAESLKGLVRGTNVFPEARKSKVKNIYLLQHHSYLL